ncbi:MAG: SirB2 family protein [Gammaproteobacteria bacterium]|nr:SirB2 family protein [Gammaproteobacteria bacterium]
MLYIHITCAALSLFLFTLRGIWMMKESNLLQLRVVRFLPHIIDTVLLLAAVALTIIINQFPLVTHWLTVKLIALIIYICLGMVALRLGKTKN